MLALWTSACIDTTGLTFGAGNAAGGTSATGGSGGTDVRGTGGTSGGGPGTDGLTPYAQIVLSDGPVGYWPLDEIDGSRTPDLSGNGLHALLTGDGRSMLVTDDDRPSTGHLMSLSAMALEVEAGHGMGFGNAPYTMEAWVRATLPSDASLWSCLSSAMPVEGYATTLIGNDVFHKRYPSGASPETLDVLAGLDLLRHVMVTFDGTDARAYLNGRPAAESETMGSWNGTGWPLLLADAGESEAFTVDEIAIYDKALTETDAMRHFSCGHDQICD